MNLVVPLAFALSLLGTSPPAKHPVFAKQPMPVQPPPVTFPTGPAPSKLVTRTLHAGTGRAIMPGDSVRVHYAGYLWSTHAVFDESYSRGAPPEFPIGRGMLIRGWDQGMIGMRVGEQRMLIIPPSMGYGAHGHPPTIPANETLIFVVELVAIK